MKTFAVGDIHGMHDMLMKALDMIEAASHSPCRVIFLGDYIDRGPDSSRVVTTLMAGPRRVEDQWICLKGNHEDMMLQCLGGQTRMTWWLDNGGYQAMESFGGHVPDAVRKWCADLPVSYEDKHRLYVHAGIDPWRDWDDQDDETMMWIRDKFLCHAGMFPKHVVHGHTPGRDIELLDNRTNLDSGACFGGPLSIAMFEDKKAGGPIRTFQVKP